APVTKIAGGWSPVFARRRIENPSGLLSDELSSAAAGIFLLQPRGVGLTESAITALAFAGHLSVTVPLGPGPLPISPRRIGRPIFPAGGRSPPRITTVAPDKFKGAAAASFTSHTPHSNTERHQPERIRAPPNPENTRTRICPGPMRRPITQTSSHR